MKDNFSIQSDAYARYRPVYPRELYDFLIPLVREKKTAWDCGTGNGQVAYRLADYFEMVYASDISTKQIANARPKSNIKYSIELAGRTSFSDNQFNLITVAQAIHWFDLDKFYKEVRRTLKPGGTIAVIGYSLVRFDHEIDRIIDHLHNHILGNYWDDARKLIDNHYSNLPFPFDEIPTEGFNYKRNWTLEELTGYLSTWSALQHYIRKNGKNPFRKTSIKLKEAWGDSETLKGETPIFTRIGY